MWNVKPNVIPVTTETTETISKSLRRYLSNIPGKKEMEQLQQTDILGTAHILREVLMSKYRTFNMGNNITCAMSCNYKTNAIL